MQVQVTAIVTATTELATTHKPWNCVKNGAISGIFEKPTAYPRIFPSPVIVAHQLLAWDCWSSGQLSTTSARMLIWMAWTAKLSVQIHSTARAIVTLGSGPFPCASSVRRWTIGSIHPSARIERTTPMPPEIMNGRRRPQELRLWSLSKPKQGWTRLPHRGPAIQTIAVNVFDRPREIRRG